MALPQEHVPVATPMPEPPPDDFLDKTQWDVLKSLIDAVIPSIVAQSALADKATQVPLADDEFDRVLDDAIKSMVPSHSKDGLRSFLESRPSEDPRFLDNVVRTMAFSSPSQVKMLGGILSLLATRPGSLLLTGCWQPAYNQTAETRQAILQSWLTARTSAFRTLAKTIVTLAQKANAQTNPILGELSGYTDVPRNWQAGPGFDYEFLQFNGDDDDLTTTVETDVVIVGSGCGGGVSAKNLAEAGHKVLVVDKGYHFPPSHLPMPQDAACRYLYDNGGLYITDDSGATVLAGSAWGGGGTVNWSVCLKLQDYVRREWAEDHGLPFFASPEFDECTRRVWDFCGAGATTDQLRHNHRNRVLLDGAQKLRWAAGEAHQNTAGKEHYCGQCHLGCGSAEKRGPAVSWLPAAARAGAEFMEGFTVDKILFDGETAVSVEGEWLSRDPDGGVSGPLDQRTKKRVVVKAKRVILSAGSIWSPVLLMKSGLQNRNIGHNLHIHPCNLVTAVYEERVQPWEGGIITSYCTEFENIDEKGHGVKLEPTCMVPYTILSMAPWTSGLDTKLLMLKYPHLDGFIALTRDRDSGRVYPDPTTGRPRVDYTVSDYDREHTLEGVQALAKLCYVTGAKEIRPLLPNLEPFVQTQTPKLDEEGAQDPEFSDPVFAAWLKKLRAAGNQPPAATWSSAHQMGTCRMSADAAEGVVDESGQVWGAKNLYVADASVFPSASGVNPMITVMTIADWVSRGVSDGLNKQV